MNQRALATALVFLGAFLFLAVVLRGDPVAARAFDLRFAHAASLISPGWIPYLLDVTFLGSAAGIIIGALLVSFYFASPGLYARLFVAIGASAATAAWFKSFFGRARPDAASLYVHDNSLSFPSGHATAAAALYGFLACLLYARARTPIQKALVVMFAAIVIGAVGASRVALGVHYATDVLGGFLLAGAWIALAFALPPHTRLKR